MSSRWRDKHTPEAFNSLEAARSVNVRGNQTTATCEKTIAELNFHINLVRKLPLRDSNWFSKRPSGESEWNTSGNLSKSRFIVVSSSKI